jgi:hypothetical protein
MFMPPRLQYDINTQDYTDGRRNGKAGCTIQPHKGKELRWTFILGQLQEMNHNQADAIASYNRVAKATWLLIWPLTPTLTASVLRIAKMVLK